MVGFCFQFVLHLSQALKGQVEAHADSTGKHRSRVAAAGEVCTIQQLANKTEDAIYYEMKGERAISYHRQKRPGRWMRLRFLGRSSWL